jgi:adenine/guanine phosphoribosyltransferase-like PRPP-binding protein
MIYHGESGDLTDLEKNVRRATKTLREHADEYDFIAVTGMSGVIVGVPASLRLHKPLVILRKETDHNDHHVGGTFIGLSAASGRYVVLDDFMLSGRTVACIRSAIDTTAGWWNPQLRPQFVGFVSYADDTWLSQV